MPRVNHVKKARKAQPDHDIAIGDSYYWWKFAFGPKVCSKTYPKPWHLTQSPFLQQLYQIQDQLENLDADDTLEDAIQNISGEIDQLGQECQENLDNMPESLQETSDAGEILRERIDAMEQWSSDLQGIDFDADRDPEEILEEIMGTDPGVG